MTHWRMYPPHNHFPGILLKPQRKADPFNKGMGSKFAECGDMTFVLSQGSFMHTVLWSVLATVIVVLVTCQDLMIMNPFCGSRRA